MTFAELLVILGPVLGVATYLYIAIEDDDYEDFLSPYWQGHFDDLPFVGGVVCLPVLMACLFAIGALIHRLSPDLFAQYEHIMSPVFKALPTMSAGGWMSYVFVPLLLIWCFWLSVPLLFLVPKLAYKYRALRRAT